VSCSHSTRLMHTQASASPSAPFLPSLAEEIALLERRLQLADEADAAAVAEAAEAAEFEARKEEQSRPREQSSS
jgi:hypothetical protein